MQFQIDTGSRQPIYRQLIEQVRTAAARGKLHPGERLPSVRSLSQQLVVNPNTIAKAYTELEREGVLNTRPGMGVFVAEPRDELTRKARRERLLAALDSFLTAAVHLGFSAQEVVQLTSDRATQFQWNDSPSTTR